MKNYYFDYDDDRVAIIEAQTIGEASMIFAKAKPHIEKFAVKHITAKEAEAFISKQAA